VGTPVFPSNVIFKIMSLVRKIMGTLSRQELKDMLLVYFMDQWWYCTVE